MPDSPSGTGTGNEPNPAAAAGQQGAGSGQGGSGAPGAQSEAERQQQDQRLTAEAAKWRTQFRDATKQIDELKQQVEELKSKPGSPAGGDTSELATLKRTLADLQKTVQQERELRTNAETARRQEKLDNALLKAVGEAKLLDPDDAVIVLRNKGRAKIADDGKPVFVISENGEEREIEITAASIKQHKLVSERFFPSDGVPGSGSRPGPRGSAPAGLDYERGLKDPAYFREHEKEMREEFKRRNTV
jgi:hypothetical protein